jgi:hypothetical protein
LEVERILFMLGHFSKARKHAERKKFALGLQLSMLKVEVKHKTICFNLS